MLWGKKGWLAAKIAVNFRGNTPAESYDNRNSFLKTGKERMEDARAGYHSVYKEFIN